MNDNFKRKAFYVAYSAVVSTAIATIGAGIVALFNHDIAIIFFGILFGFVFSELLERGWKKLP
jgi:hypothetical protein